MYHRHMSTSIYIYIIYTYIYTHTIIYIYKYIHMYIIYIYNYMCSLHMYWLNFKHFNWTFCESAERQRVGKAHSPAKRPNSTCSRLPCAFWGPKWEPIFGTPKSPKVHTCSNTMFIPFHTCSMMFNVFGFKFILYTFLLRAHFASNSSTKCRSRRCTKCIKPWPAREQKNDGLVAKQTPKRGRIFWSQGKQVCSWRSQPLPALGPITQVTRDILHLWRLPRHLLPKPPANRSIQLESRLTFQELKSTNLFINEYR
jgi:hypothetical protein